MKASRRRLQRAKIDLPFDQDELLVVRDGARTLRISYRELQARERRGDPDPGHVRRFLLDVWTEYPRVRVDLPEARLN